MVRQRETGRRHSMVPLCMALGTWEVKTLPPRDSPWDFGTVHTPHRAGPLSTSLKLHPPLPRSRRHHQLTPPSQRTHQETRLPRPPPLLYKVPRPPVEPALQRARSRVGALVSRAESAGGRAGALGGGDAGWVSRRGGRAGAGAARGAGETVLGWRHASVDSGVEGEAVEGFGLRGCCYCHCFSLLLGVSVRVRLRGGWVDGHQQATVCGLVWRKRRGRGGVGLA